MPLLGLTTSQAKFARWLIRAAGEAIPAGLAWLASDLASNPEAPSTLEWRRFHVIWSRAVPGGLIEDRAQFKLDLVNVTADELDVTWTAGDYAACLTPIQTFMTAQAARSASSQTWQEVRAYRMRFNDIPDVARPFADSGPPAYVAALTGGGSQSGAMPFQIAPTVTLRTSWTKHWGRVYLPTPASTMIDSAYGRLTTTFTGATPVAFKTMLSSLTDAGFYPVVPVGQLDKQPFHALLGITQVVVDDIPDVQRRRRAKQAAVRTVG